MEKVGYGKPPQRTRFKKGRSGNPKGRPRGRKNIASVIREYFYDRVRVKGENGDFYYIPKIEAVMVQLTNKAALGDMRATRLCFDLIQMFPEVRDDEFEEPIINIHFVDPKDTSPARIEGGEGEVKRLLESGSKSISDE
jgi:hypothetical protein